jgi:D-lyxose ketol-isomerase
MDYRQNDATINRPEGERVLDGDCIYTDLVEIVNQLRNEKAYDTNDLNGITVLKTGSTTIVVTLMKQGSFSKRITVDTALTLLVMSGKLTIEKEGSAIELGPAQMLNFHPLIAHDIKAEIETVVIQITHG